MADGYELLASVYDEWQSHGGARPLWRFALERLESALLGDGGSVGSYLDWACGTGGLLVELARRRPGWRLAGIDASEAMLVQARSHRGSERLELRRASFGDAEFDAEFDAAGCFSDALNHLGSIEALQRALAAMGAGLRPGGRLVFDVTNRTGFGLWWNARRTWMLGRRTLTIDHEFDAASRRAVAFIRLEDGEGSRNVLEGRIEQRWFTEGEVRNSLGAAGLEVEVMEPWAPFGTGVSGKTWFVARRPR